MVILLNSITIIVILFNIDILNIHNKKFIKTISNNYYNNVNNNSEKPLLILEIPIIDLHKNIYNYTSNLNDIKKNVKILSNSSIEDKTFILASHSGTNKNAYFNDLNKINLYTLVYIYYSQHKYIYQITKKYNINKTGYLEIDKNLTNKIILITCSTTNKDKQLILEGNLINVY